MYVAIKTNKTNMKFFKKARNGKPITYNEKLVIYLFPSKLTERYIAIKTNEKNMKNKILFQENKMSL